MPATDITYTTRAGESFTGYLSSPDSGAPAPGILLITAIFGVDDEMKELADAWAADGFVVSVPDIFWRVMPGPTDDMEKAFARYGAFDADQGMLDIEDLIEDLKARPECNGKIGMLGFCFGGRYAHLAAARLGIDAAAAFHGTRIGEHLDETPNITCPVSFHFGAVDPAVPLEEFTAITEAYASHPNAEIVLHDDAAHNFAMLYKPGYQEAAAKASRDAALKCLRSI